MTRPATSPTPRLPASPPDAVVDILAQKIPEIWASYLEENRQLPALPRSTHLAYAPNVQYFNEGLIKIKIEWIGTRTR